MAQNGAKIKSNVVKIDQTELWRMGSNCSGFIASLVSIAITCTYAAARAAAFAKNDLWEHYHMIRQRKRPNAKEAKTLKAMDEFKRSGFGSWKTSGIAASHRLASYLSDPREARRIAADIAKLPELLRP